MPILRAPNELLDDLLHFTFLSMDYAQELADSFDVEKLGVLRVRQLEDKKLHVADGRHRRMAAILAGYGDDRILPCTVIPYWQHGSAGWITRKRTYRPRTMTTRR